MDKSKYNREKKEFKIKQKELKAHFKSERPSFRMRVIKKTIEPFYMGLNSIILALVNAKEKVGKRVHAKKVAIYELEKKVDYIVDSLKATANTTDEIRAKTIEDIVENIDDL